VKTAKKMAFRKHGRPTRGKGSVPVGKERGEKDDLKRRGDWKKSGNSGVSGLETILRLEPDSSQKSGDSFRQREKRTKEFLLKNRSQEKKTGIFTGKEKRGAPKVTFPEKRGRKAFFPQLQSAGKGRDVKTRPACQGHRSGPA